MKKTYGNRIHELREELREEIICLLNKHKNKRITVPADIDEKLFVVWIDGDGYAQDSEVLKIYLDDEGKITLDVEDSGSFQNVTLYTGNDMALEHVEWLEDIRSLLFCLLEGDEWHICPECGELTSENFSYENGNSTEYYCSEECLQKATDSKDSRKKRSDEIGIVIGRPINGITINGLEYILNDAKALMHFPDMESARAFLTQQGIDHDVEDLHYHYHTYCLNCGEEYFLKEDETFTDESGKGHLCGKCGSSFDVI